MIFLLSPNNESVHGGIKIINQHAWLLKEHGHEVIIADFYGKKATWLARPFDKIISYSDVKNLSKTDIVVAYWNGIQDVSVAFSGKAKKYFVVLNTQPPSVKEAPIAIQIDNDMIGEEVFNLKWDGILCTTEYLKNLCFEYDKEASLITVGVDTNLFVPGNKIPNTVAYFPRRGTFVDNNRKFITDLGLTLIPIDNKPETVVAKILSESEYFLSITTGVFWNCHSLKGEPRPAIEGWNMPVHEAMACGCSVIGYRANSAPFMNNDTCYLVEDDNEEMFRSKIIEAIKDNKKKFENAMNIARYYSFDMMYETLARGLGIWEV